MEDDWTHVVVGAAPKKEYWGYHCIINASNCSGAKIGSEKNHRDFLKALVKDIDMVAYGDPVIAHFATHDPSKGGYTIMQMIETSSITGHFVDETGEAYLDVFSCKPFSVDAVLDVVRRFYEPTTMQQQMIYRKAWP